MRLGIISDAHHYYNAEGRLCTLSPLAHQFEMWAQLFDEVIVCAPLLHVAPPPVAGPYNAANISLLPVENGGGNSVAAKLRLVVTAAGWALTIRRLLSRVDAVHVRCPNNISIVGLPLVAMSRVLRQAVFTGNWLGYSGEAPTYKAQRLYLAKRFKGPVAVYGDWPNQHANIVPSFSPTYGVAEWHKEGEAVAHRLAGLNLASTLPQPLQLLSVGWLDANKNQQLVVRAIKVLQEMGVNAELRLLGGGTMHGYLVQLVGSLGLEDRVFLLGNTSHEDVRRYYRSADFVVQAPFTEGFSKVPIEAFFHGVVPVLSDVSLNSQVVDGGSRGRVFPQGDAQAIARQIAELAARPLEMAGLIRNGREYARSLTLEAWRDHLQAMLERSWGVKLSLRLDGLPIDSPRPASVP